jgi:hypothetical protein
MLSVYARPDPDFSVRGGPLHVEADGEMVAAHLILHWYQNDG